MNKKLVLLALPAILGCSREQYLIDYWIPHRSTIIANQHQVIVYDVKTPRVIQKTFFIEDGELTHIITTNFLSSEKKLYQEIGGRKIEYPSTITQNEEINEVFFKSTISNLNLKIKISGEDKERDCIESKIQSPPLKQVYCKNIGLISRENGENTVFSIDQPQKQIELQPSTASSLIHVMASQNLAAKLSAEKKHSKESNKELAFSEKQFKETLNIYSETFKIVAGFKNQSFYSLDNQIKHRYGESVPLDIIDSAIFTGCIIKNNQDAVVTFLNNQDDPFVFGNSIEGENFAGDIAQCLEKTRKLLKKTKPAN